jgi:hypothetical protein
MELKEAMQLDTDKRHIWSSSTLYSEEIREERSIFLKRFRYAYEVVRSRNV